MKKLTKIIKKIIIAHEMRNHYRIYCSLLDGMTRGKELTEYVFPILHARLNFHTLAIENLQKELIALDTQEELSPGKAQGITL